MTDANKEYVTFKLPMQPGVPTMNGRVYSEECMKDLAKQMEGRLVFLQSERNYFKHSDLSRCVGTVREADVNEVRVKLLPGAQGVENLHLNPVMNAVPREDGKYEQVELQSIGLVGISSRSPERSKDS